MCAAGRAASPEAERVAEGRWRRRRRPPLIHPWPAADSRRRSAGESDDSLMTTPRVATAEAFKPPDVLRTQRSRLSRSLFFRAVACAGPTPTGPTWTPRFGTSKGAPPSAVGCRARPRRNSRVPKKRSLSGSAAWPASRAACAPMRSPTSSHRGELGSGLPSAPRRIESGAVGAGGWTTGRCRSRFQVSG